MTAAATPMIPSNGCISPMIARKIGAHGESKIALTPGPLKNAPDRPQIPQRLCAGGRSIEGAAHAGGDQIRCEPPFQPAAHPPEQPTSDRLERTHDQDRNGGNYGEKHKRFHPSTRQHAIVHQPHVDRRNEDQHVHRKAESRQHRKARAELLQRLLEGVRFFSRHRNPA